MDSYNGVELPTLPEWDKETYPYALITHFTGIAGTIDDHYRLICWESLPPTYVSSNKDYIGNSDADADPIPAVQATYWDGDTAWKGFEEFTVRNASLNSLVWANFDVYASDNTLYLAASDPVPVTIPKWAHMNSFLAGLALGLAGKPLVLAREPVAYLYNGVRLPKLPEWDRVAYPYAVITGWRTAYVISEPFVVTDSAPFDKATPKVPFLRSTRKSDEYSGKEYWSEWEEVAESETILLYSGLWANHEILYTDETVCTPKGNNPIPVYLPEILFDGEVTVEANDVGICKVDILFANYYAVGDTLKVTINGVTEEYTVIKGYFGGQEIIGNEELINSGLTGVVDTGGAWGIVNLGRTDTGAYDVRLYTRNPGTYQLKIERIALGQE